MHKNRGEDTKNGRSKNSCRGVRLAKKMRFCEYNARKCYIGNSADLCCTHCFAKLSVRLTNKKAIFQELSSLKIYLNL